MRDKKWDNEALRKPYVGLLELMTPPKPRADLAAAGKSALVELIGRTQDYLRSEGAKRPTLRRICVPRRHPFGHQAHWQQTHQLRLPPGLLAC